MKWNIPFRGKESSKLLGRIRGCFDRDDSSIRWGRGFHGGRQSDGQAQLGEDAGKMPLGAFLVFLGADALNSAAAQETSQGQQLYDQGLRLLKAGNSQQALPLLQKATILLPDNRHVMADYVVALVWAGEYRRAVDYYRGQEQNFGKSAIYTRT